MIEHQTEPISGLESKEIKFKSLEHVPFQKFIFWSVFSTLLLTLIPGINFPFLSPNVFFTLFVVILGLYYAVRYFFLVEVAFLINQKDLQIETEGKFNLHYKKYILPLSEVLGFEKYNIDRKQSFRYIVLHLKNNTILRLNIHNENDYYEVVKTLECITIPLEFHNQSYFSRAIRAFLLFTVITIINAVLVLLLNYLFPSFVGKVYFNFKSLLILGISCFHYWLINKMFITSLSWNYLLKNNLKIGVLLVSVMSLFISFLYEPISQPSNLNSLMEINDSGKLKGNFFYLHNDSVRYSSTQLLIAQSNRKLKNPKVAAFVKDDRYDIIHHNILRIYAPDIEASTQPIYIYLDQKFEQTIWKKKKMNVDFRQQFEEFENEASRVALQKIQHKPTYYRIIYSDTIKRFHNANFEKQVKESLNWNNNITVIEPYWESFDNKLTEHKELQLIFAAYLIGIITFMTFALVAQPLKSQFK